MSDSEKKAEETTPFYQILWGVNSAAVASKTNAALLKGAKPLGGVAISEHNTAQALMWPKGEAQCNSAGVK